MIETGWGDEQTKYFFELTPDKVFDAVEELGVECTGFCMALNSFENRVYEVEVEEVRDAEKKRMVAKFYRPGRWSKDQILEEHQFLLDLHEAEIPVVTPIRFGSATLHQTKDSNIFYALFPKIGGRAPEELNEEQLIRIGRLLARIHNVGSAKEALHRVRISPESYGLNNLKFLIENDWIPIDFQRRYTMAVEEMCNRVKPIFEKVKVHRIHGDCHLGNLLWGQQGPFFLDFDDMLNGPAVQDIWLLLPNRSFEESRSLDILLKGYDEMRSFDNSSLKLIEPLRGLRFVHYTAWIARRWKDPAFPLSFPHFGSYRYWEEVTADVEEQIRLIK